ncbi:MAG: DUF4397 domain-containing protein [Bacteroidota bacterium]
MKILKAIHVRNFLIVAISAAIFASCKKDETPPVVTPAAGFMAFNLAPDQNAVVFSLSGSNVGTSTLPYNGYSGVYNPVYTGSREVRAFDNSTNTTLATTPGNFADSMYYSSFLIGTNGNYRTVLVQDNLDSLPVVAGKAYVRYINAITDSTIVPVVSVEATGETTITENAAFGNVSSFTQVNAGPLTTTVSDGINTLASRVITLEENKVYTLLLSGIPGTSDSTKVVQVKYIQNGTIAP